MHSVQPHKCIYLLYHILSPSSEATACWQQTKVLATVQYALCITQQ